MKGLRFAVAAFCFLAGCATQKGYLQYNIPPHNVAQYHTSESPTSESSLELITKSENEVRRPVRVAILDTGCNNIPYEEGTSFVDGTVADLNGHGTAIAEIIKEINPNVELYIAKVFGKYEHTMDITPVVKGLYWAISHQVDLVCIPCETRMDHKAIHDAIQKAYNQGILLVAPTGNKDVLDVLLDDLCNTKGVKYPARYEEVVAVSAIDSFFGLFYWSTSVIGPEVEFVCYGPDGAQNSSSIAVGRAAGVISKIKEDYPHLNVRQLREGLQLYARDLGDKGRDPKFGYGRLDTDLPRSGHQLSRDLHYVGAAGVILFAAYRAVR